jgi:K+-transporting ATPase A subunit
VLPLNPTDVGGVPSALSFNTAASFVTNTNWQNYGGESTMSHLTQMAGLAVQNFVSAAVGIAVAVALVRGLTCRRSATIGNFWADLTRITVRVLVPLATVIALLLASQGYQGDAYADLGEVLRLVGKPGEAVAALEEAVERYERKGNLVSSQRAQTRLAEIRPEARAART